MSFSQDSLQATDGVSAIPQFTINAYNGGKMRPNGFAHDVVFDLSSSQANKVPVFLDHETSGRGLVGHAEQTNDGEILSADGIVSAVTA